MFETRAHKVAFEICKFNVANLSLFVQLCVVIKWTVHGIAICLHVIWFDMIYIRLKLHKLKCPIIEEVIEVVYKNLGSTVPEAKFKVFLNLRNKNFEYFIGFSIRWV